MTNVTSLELEIKKTELEQELSNIKVAIKKVEESLAAIKKAKEKEAAQQLPDAIFSVNKPRGPYKILKITAKRIHVINAEYLYTEYFDKETGKSPLYLGRKLNTEACIAAFKTHKANLKSVI